MIEIAAVDDDEAELDHLVVILDRRIVLSLCDTGDAAIVVWVGEWAASARNGQVVILHRAVEFKPLLRIGDAAPIDRGEMIGLEPDRDVETSGLRDRAAPDR